jgi:hypothetical protein
MNLEKLIVPSLKRSFHSKATNVYFSKVKRKLFWGAKVKLLLESPGGVAPQKQKALFLIPPGYKVFR